MKKAPKKEPPKKNHFHTKIRQRGSSTFLYCVMAGNYPATLRTLMNKRGNWQEVSAVAVLTRAFNAQLRLTDPP